MCTAATYKTKDFYFGRTLDFEFLYPCEVVYAPRNYPFDFRFSGRDCEHYAILGMAFVKNDYPLYFDAVNDMGLCMAGLNFVGNAVYREKIEGKVNVASFEFIPYILGKCKNVIETKAVLENLNITDTAFEEGLPPSQLHWIIADKDTAITVESVKEGLRVYENEVGVLTNNPPFPIHLQNLERNNSLTPVQAEVTFDTDGEFSSYSRGTGAVGLPGDYTSQSRFVRAAFVARNSHSGESEEESVNQFFHIMNSVSVPEGCCRVENGDFDKTLYISCMNAQKGIYYYKAYESQQIFGVYMEGENPLCETLKRYNYRKDFCVTRQN
ncbi:MAG: choloylglycine hydrolase [Ruminococcus sp.]|nr:choloylglycine hydrolase [Ruminococcus sp.]